MFILQHTWVIPTTFSLSLLDKLGWENDWSRTPSELHWVLNPGHPTSKSNCPTTTPYSLKANFHVSLLIDLGLHDWISALNLLYFEIYVCNLDTPYSF